MVAMMGSIACSSTRAADPRDGDQRTLDGYFPFKTVTSAKAWRERAEEISLRVKVGMGLWPEPTKTPLNAVVHGLMDMGDYTIEKVFFESMPGHFVTGNLYRPKKQAVGARYPAILMPHGHWPNGRFMDALAAKGGARQVRESLANGAERFESAARSPLQARCVQAARMGCVAFHYDMLGNADSLQFPKHRRLTPGEKGESWLMGGADAANWLHSRMGLQTWNSVRALDFVIGLPDVDASRVGVSGASGGATQTMMVTAIDPRVRVAFPAVMVSTAMQGGCLCENTYYLRIGQGNIDIAATTAPRPLGVTVADDWTKELATKGHPDLQAVYKMLGAPTNYEAHFNPQFKHNYNHVSRSQLYGFLNKYFKLGLEGPVLEKDFKFLACESLSVWDEKHPAPSGQAVGDPHERSLCKWWADDTRGQMKALLAPADAASLERARGVIGKAVSVMVGRGMWGTNETEYLIHEERSGRGWSLSAGTLRHKPTGEEVGLALVRQPSEKEGGPAIKGAVLVLSPEGSDDLMEDPGRPTKMVETSLSAGWAVAAIDVHRPGAKWNRRVVEPKTKPEDPWQRDAILTYAYNSPLFIQRVHDVMTAVSWLRGDSPVKGTKIRLVGMDGAGHLAAVAAATIGDDIERSAIDVGGFQFASLRSPWAADFLPGAAKYGDVGGMLLLLAPRPLWLTGVGEGVANNIKGAYAVAGAEGSFVFEAQKIADPAGRATEWILRD